MTVALLRSVLANAQLARLEWVGVASLSRWALMILIGISAYRTAGAGAVGAAALARMLPSALATPWLAARVEHACKRSMLLATLAVRCAALITMITTVAHHGPLWLLLALGALYAIADAGQDPARAALFPVHARTPTELAAANTLWTILENGAFLAGSLLVGVFVTALGVTAAFAACLVPVAAAALAAAGLQRDRVGAPAERSGALSDLLGGARAITRDRDLRLLSSLNTATMFIEGACDVLIIIAAVSLFALGAQGAGWLNAAWGTGAVIGGLTFAARITRGRLWSGLATGLVLGGLPLMITSTTANAAVACAAFLALGVGFGMTEAAVVTLTQRLVATDTLARVQGSYQTLKITSQGIAALAATALVQILGIQGALITTGAVLPALAAILWRRLRALQPAPPPSPDAFKALRALDIFAAMPVATVETLASRAHTTHLDAGSEFISQRDAANTFYVVVHGSVDIEHNGQWLRTQHEGSYFGEIAPLNATARTATVRAHTQVRLLTIDATVFLAAINPDPRSRHAAEHTARTRLSNTTAITPDP